MFRNRAARVAALEATHAPVAMIEEALDAAEKLARAQEDGADPLTLEALEADYAAVYARLPERTRRMLEDTPEDEPFDWPASRYGA